MIDDAGAEHQTPATLGLLHGMLQSRLGQWTVITTNLSPDAWRQRDERIGSRLIRDSNVHVDCTTADYATREPASVSFGVSGLWAFGYIGNWDNAAKPAACSQELGDGRCKSWRWLQRRTE